MKLDRDTKRVILGGSVGALVFAVGYGLWSHRQAITQPLFGAVEHDEHGRHEPHQKHKKDHHEDNKRGEYGHKKHKEHKRDD